MTQTSEASDLQVALLTAGRDQPYAFGIATALRAQGIRIDLVCGDDLDVAELCNDPGITILNFRPHTPAAAGVARKALAIIRYYFLLIRYAARAKPMIFHILWNNKFETIDRVLLMLYYRLLGKRVVLTAHNVNAATRDEADSGLNRLTLWIQYRLCDHIFVHTDKMKAELIRQFAVRAPAVTVVRFGINNAVPRTALTTREARERLGLSADDKVVLFFGNIAPYKGLEYLVTAFRDLNRTRDGYRLIVAGRVKKGSDPYWENLQTVLGPNPSADGVLLNLGFVPDEETELYFKAADVLALPYTRIFQSGVLFLAYSFGLPVLAADVGSLKDDVIEGATGFVFAPEDAKALARAIETYFDSDLFGNLEEHRIAIRELANDRYSWAPLADATRRVYGELMSSSLSSSVATT
jgi:glycosyltransferase involved in cell wall biosynthesis